MPLLAWRNPLTWSFANRGYVCRVIGGDAAHWEARNTLRIHAHQLSRTRNMARCDPRHYWRGSRGRVQRWAGATAGRPVSCRCPRDEARFRKVIGDDAPPVIRLHDLRHTHATIQFDRARAHPRGRAAPRPRVAGCHDDRLRACPAGQPAGGRRPVRPADRGGEGRVTAEVSIQCHEACRAGITGLSPGEMPCPRGDLNPHALYGH